MVATKTKGRTQTNKKKQSKSSVPKEIKILIGAAIAVILELCNLNLLGTVGGLIKSAQFGLFGIMAYVFPLLVLAGAFFIGLSENKTAKIICAACVFLFAGAIVHQSAAALYEDCGVFAYYTVGVQHLAGGGFICGLFSRGLYLAVGNVGLYIISGLAIVVCLLIIFEFYTYFGREKEAKEPAPEPVVKTAAPAKKGMRSRAREQEVFKTEEEDGTVIRIVHKPSKNKIKHVDTKRADNKAKPMRDGTVQKRSGTKVKGIASDLDLEKKRAGGDDVHEITNTAATRQVSVPEHTQKKPQERTISVRDVSSEPRPEARSTERAVKSLRPASAQAPAPATQAPLKAAAAGSKGGYTLPPLSLLGKKKVQTSSVKEDYEKTSKSLEYVLEQFGVYAKVVNVQTGPAVTRYELQPEMGTRVSKFTSLSDDLKLNLAVSDIRIEAPVPGKSVVGIEIPNKSVQPVTLRELLEAPELTKTSSKLAFAAGRSISGDVITGDIATMPHLLIAGTTGSGKSVFTKSIIMEILYRARPDEVGLIVVDPKKVEFNVFEGIPHLMKGVVTDPGQAVSTLRWAVNEMMIRYDRMNKNGVNNIHSYNEKLAMGQISESELNPQKMPQIVIVIDELADLMMVAKKEVESYICRLAQLSRAAGIHMIIATQRPSADVVTGLIKTNIPSRVALKVASGIDSRIILDSMGAEKLLGRGDMLFFPYGYSAPVRVQGAFVTDKEVNDTVNYLLTHKSGSYYADKEKEIEDFINTSSQTDSDKAQEGSATSGNAYDEFFHDAGLLCIEMGRASSSMLQRRFNLGFNRAARIIDQLEEFGVIGPANGSKPREILVDSMTFEEMYQDMTSGS